jgi:acyl-CoA thioesterase-1
MHRLFLPLLLASLVASAPSRAQHLPPVSQICEAPPEFHEPEEPLPHLHAALAAGGVVHVLAIGSGTTVGEVNGTPGASFPYRMVEALRDARPDTRFDLTVKGGRNMSAETMLSLLKEELSRQHYPLVLWQTGTVEAVRGLRPDMMRTFLQEGIDAVQAEDGDVVLVDSQFSRFLRANADLDPYESVMQQIATLPGVVLFHRFELMRIWASDGRIDLERVQKADRENAVAALNACLGTTLARFVLNGADQVSN